jgi:hypothetical protein
MAVLVQARIGNSVLMKKRVSCNALPSFIRPDHRDIREAIQIGCTKESEKDSDANELPPMVSC